MEEKTEREKTSKKEKGLPNAEALIRNYVKMRENADGDSLDSLKISSKVWQAIQNKDTIENLNKSIKNQL